MTFSDRRDCVRFEIPLVAADQVTDVIAGVAEVAGLEGGSTWISTHAFIGSGRETFMVAMRVSSRNQIGTR